MTAGPGARSARALAESGAILAPVALTYVTSDVLSSSSHPWDPSRNGAKIARRTRLIARCCYSNRLIRSLWTESRCACKWRSESWCSSMLRPRRGRASCSTSCEQARTASGLPQASWSASRAARTSFQCSSKDAMSTERRSSSSAPTDSAPVRAPMARRSWMASAAPTGKGLRARERAGA